MYMGVGDEVSLFSKIAVGGMLLDGLLKKENIGSTSDRLYLNMILFQLFNGTYDLRPNHLVINAAQLTGNFAARIEDTRCA